MQPLPTTLHGRRIAAKPLADSRQTSSHRASRTGRATAADRSGLQGTERTGAGWPRRRCPPGAPQRPAPTRATGVAQAPRTRARSARGARSASRRSAAARQGRTGAMPAARSRARAPPSRAPASARAASRRRASTPAPDAAPRRPRRPGRDRSRSKGAGSRDRQSSALDGAVGAAKLPLKVDRASRPAGARSVDAASGALSRC